MCEPYRLLNDPSYGDISSQLHSNRPPLPDVPAVYFVSPTLPNIRRIAEDLEKNLYERFHLSFVEPLPRSLLEELAASVAKDGTGDLIEQASALTQVRTNIKKQVKVLDQYLSFLSPSPSLFSLLPPTNSSSSAGLSAAANGAAPPAYHSSYALLNSPATSEQQIEQELERIANGLFSVVATMGTYLFSSA